AVDSLCNEWIDRSISADPRFGKASVNLGDLIVDSMPHFAAQVRTTIQAYERYCGDGEGETFFMGPYLDLLPSAVSKWVRDSVRRPAGCHQNRLTASAVPAQA